MVTGYGQHGPAYAEPVQVLVVDGANVVGSRPDGWWRDRAGAALRLHGSLTTSSLAHDELVLVLEGAARRGVEPGSVGPVRTVHAQGSGDDAIVTEVVALVAGGAEVAVVTADRGLRARVEATGATVLGPTWLLGQL